MTIRNLEGFFAPTSLAVIGPPRHPAEATAKLLEVLESNPASFPIFTIDLPTRSERFKKVSSIKALPIAPDLAICLGPKKSIPKTIARLAKAGTRAVLLWSPGFAHWPEDLLQACREAGRPTSLRLIGPGSLGMAVPATGLNVLTSARPPIKGDIALIARSSAVLNATLTWAERHQVGFSAAVSLGARTDADVGDLIDYFAQDHRTRAILLHLEGISTPRKFLSAARAAARSKPVIVIRSGRSRDIVGTGRTHAGRLADPDAVYEAVFRRTGLMRVDDFDEMFEAVETLSRIRIPKSEAFAVVANGRSLASLATDRLLDMGGRLASLSDDTLKALQPLVRRGVNVTDAAPVILSEHVPREDLKAAIGILLGDLAVDGVLVLQAPSLFTPIETTAQAIADAAEADKKRSGRKKALVAGLIGASSSLREHLDAAKVPSFRSPAGAVRSMMHIAQDARSRDFLMAAPPSLPADFVPDSTGARRIVERALSAGQTWLAPDDVSAILSAYHIPVIATRLAKTPLEAASLSESFFKSARHAVVKLISPDLPFKSRIDGVRLGIESPAGVAASAEELISQTRRIFPHAEIAGVSIHPMLEDRHGLELFMGLADTPLFGPVIVFGHGGTSVEDSADISIELPPLDLNLAHALINRTRIAKLLDGGSTRPQLDRDALALALVKLSQIAIDIPEIIELDINPIIARQSGILGLDARMTLGRPTEHPGRAGKSRLAIAPYPKEWEQTLCLKNGKSVFVRPVRPDDEDLFRTFFEHVATEDLRLRFFAPVRDFSHRFLARLTQLDYARAMAFAALDPETGSLEGVVRLHADPDHQTGEYAVMVRSDLKGHGLGWALMKLIIRYATADGISTVKGEVLKENTSMLSMCQALGFSVSTSGDDPGIAEVTLNVADLPEDDA
ncbi:bifunctional acetate--CoA ligase family protein/GNAT family N-acetyltransferase [Roseibium sp. RKSG952]|uniref:bifunctional acetate--CoA ligase family protein/GNAT family N-acetyltransferase n=1 Tax=Roseibium sp. RKSG952 TaxID=2529384 RepID=UPI0012BD4B73|nr:bifunctional acetate--CoA ligase family protein/GNAT family N-acetyltransferase [Roseibium sp. RKSG952]MTH99783.1 GNAT family N-acetyltransferase [Roseibium sp. RKSG952]